MLLFLYGGLALMAGAAWVLISSGLRQSRPAATCIYRGAGGMVAALGLLIAGIRLGTGRDVVQAWQGLFQENLKLSLGIYRQWNWSEEELARAAHWATVLFSDAIYGWLIVGALVAACGLYLLMRRVLPGLPGSRTALRFSEWSPPAGTVWLLLAALGLLTLGLRDGGWPRSLALNSLVVLAAFYLAAGVSVIVHFLRRRGLPRRTQILLILVAAAFPSLIFLVTGIGLLNTWWDLRRAAQKKLESPEQ